MNEINWKEIAPKRADWERLIDAWEAAGLPHITFVNGEPQFPKGAEIEAFVKIATGQGSSPSVASPAPKDSLPGPLPKQTKAVKKTPVKKGVKK